MINPKELRIGNLVYCNTAKLIVKVQWPHPAQLVVDIKGPLVRCEYTHGDLEEFDPIALTPEWLERCGFEKGGDYGEGIGYFWEHAQDVCLVELIDENTFQLFGSEWRMGKPFQYLHQLQNLYFALTGEELTIKETV